MRLILLWHSTCFHEVVGYDTEILRVKPSFYAFLECLFKMARSLNLIFHAIR